MKKLICLLLTGILLLSLTACSRNNTDIAVYEKFAAQDEILPELNELGEYAAVKSLYHYGSAFIFEWNAYTLIAEYKEEDYNSVKAAAEEKYTFETEKLKGERNMGADNWEAVRFNPYCTIGGYQLRLLEQGEYYADRFPKLAYFIGFNDEAHKIAYVYFKDFDLDTVESLEEVLIRFCGWSELIIRNLL